MRALAQTYRSPSFGRTTPEGVQEHPPLLGPFSGHTDGLPRSGGGLPGSAARPTAHQGGAAGRSGTAAFWFELRLPGQPGMEPADSTKGHRSAPCEAGQGTAPLPKPVGKGKSCDSRGAPVPRPSSPYLANAPAPRRGPGPAAPRASRRAPPAADSPGQQPGSKGPPATRPARSSSFLLAEPRKRAACPFCLLLPLSSSISFKQLRGFSFFFFFFFSRPSFPFSLPPFTNHRNSLPAAICDGYQFNSVF